MKTVICIDSFKGSMTSLEAGASAREGVLLALPDTEVHILPLADGGEGTAEALLSTLGGERVTVEVTGPLGEAHKASYGILPGDSPPERTAVMEMSEASGITLVPEALRSPLKTTSYGTGEMIRHAVMEKGCRKIIIGVGGSATNDGGFGMLSALGYRFLDGDGREVERAGEGLGRIVRIDGAGVPRKILECDITVASDVENPLLGENGCSAVYGPQKGADAECVRLMDGWLKSFADLTATHLGRDERSAPGAGAAGGMGFALLSYLGATLTPGAELIAEVSGLSETLRGADLVITGEGRLDGQSAMGKGPLRIAKMAKESGAAVIALAGSVTEGARELNRYIDAFFPILRSPCTLAEAMDRDAAMKNMRLAAEQAVRLFAIGRR